MAASFQRLLYPIAERVSSPSSSFTDRVVKSVQNCKGASKLSESELRELSQAILAEVLRGERSVLSLLSPPPEPEPIRFGRHEMECL